MGEMADLILDHAFTDDDLEYEQAGIACRYCKRGPFWWLEDHLGRWRLVTETGKTHSCGAYQRRTNVNTQS